MTMRPLPLAVLLALAAAPAVSQEAPPPATLDVSTMLFQMLSEGSAYANTLDPFDVNGIEIDFGDDDAESGALLDELLQGQ